MVAYGYQIFLWLRSEKASESGCTFLENFTKHLRLEQAPSAIDSTEHDIPKTGVGEVAYRRLRICELVEVRPWWKANISTAIGFDHVVQNLKAR